VHDGDRVVATKKTSKRTAAKKKPKPKRSAAAKRVAPKRKARKVERVTRAQIAEARGKAPATFTKLRAMYPDAHCELDHQGSYQLLVSVVLSAQTTDVLVNKVTPYLFAKYPDPCALAAAEPPEVGALLKQRGLGMYNNKAKNIVGLARMLVERHGAEVPRTLAELVELPGVGRKTANVVLGVAFNTPEGVVTDTHVIRLAQRLGWTKNTQPEKIEQDLMSLFPRDDWDMLSHVLIFHGRRCCFAIKPACAACGVNKDCPSAFRAETIGRK
jgi:endonuclease-3